MFKTLVVVALFLIAIGIYSLSNKQTCDETLIIKKERQSLLQKCSSKFEYNNDYYAVCPYGKNIKVDYEEYVELNASVESVPEEFVAMKHKSILEDKPFVLILAALGFLFCLALMMWLNERVSE